VERVSTLGLGGKVIHSLSTINDGIKIKSDLRISHKKIFQVMEKFQEASTSFKRTGGVHSAALSNGDFLQIFREDIGRYNALDKVIGKALFNSFKLEELIMLTSGRLSSGVVLKIIRCGIPLLISRAAATDRAIKIARERNLTLVGFVRGKRMNVYTGKERIV